MKIFKLDIRILAIPLFLFAASCTSDPGEGDPPPVPPKEEPPAQTKPAFGSFQVNLIAPSANSQGYTSVLGRFYDGVSPSPVGWKAAGTSGSCKVYTPTTPFCPAGCGSQAACVDNGVCQDYADPVVVGEVTVTGLKTKANDTTFKMNPISNNYQPVSGVVVAFPPFTEGAAVTFSAAGDTTGAAAGDTGIAAFVVTAKGIPPLNVINDSIVLADGLPVNLKWSPPTQSGNSRISVYVDISHHGGSKGKIECEGPDTGEMEIAAALVDQLKALGISGFPKLEIARKGVAASSDAEVELVLESRITKYLTIPGIISCEDDTGCPTGQTCQDDLQCK